MLTKTAQGFVDQLKSLWGEQGLRDNLEDVVRKYWIPGVIGIAGAGGLAGLGTALEGKRRGETPAERRRRIMRNALIGSGLGAGVVGGMAGLAGLSNMPEILEDQSTSKILSKVMSDRAGNIATEYGPGLLTGSLGWLLGERLSQRVREAALNRYYTEASRYLKTPVNSITGANTKALVSNMLKRKTSPRDISRLLAEAHVPYRDAANKIYSGIFHPRRWWGRGGYGIRAGLPLISALAGTSATNEVLYPGLDSNIEAKNLPYATIGGGIVGYGASNVTQSGANALFKKLFSRAPFKGKVKLPLNIMSAVVGAEGTGAVLDQPRPSSIVPFVRGISDEVKSERERIDNSIAEQRLRAEEQRYRAELDKQRAALRAAQK